MTFISRYTLSKSLLFVALMLFACGKSTDDKTTPGANADSDAAAAPGPETPASEDREPWDAAPYEALRKKLPPFDLEQDLSTKTLEELRILRNTVPARYGYLFMNADLRYYFYSTPWYKALMESRWYGNCEYSGLQPAPDIAYTPEETAFMEKVRVLEDQKRAQNYIIKNGVKYANVKNIVNTWQYDNLPENLMDKLDRNGFAIVPNNNVQLFHTYEQNDYSQTQNFVSTDLYLQVFHMHFSFMLRGLEENQFVPVLGDLLSGFEDKAAKVAGTLAEGPVKQAAQYNSALYAIPLTILGAKNVNVPPAYQKQVTQELSNIEEATATQSTLLPAYQEFQFPYDLFIPRGHYNRTDTLKRYFKAMQWLQTAPYCIDNDTDLTRAVVAAYILNTGTGRSGKPLVQLYRAILDPTSFLIGKPDNVSLIDLCNILSRENIRSIDELVTPQRLASIRNTLKEIDASKNVIKPKIENTCPAKLNFMPARFVLDNEILQEMADPDKRPFPKGLDVLASFGARPAEDILVKELNEDKAWNKFLPKLGEMKTKYSHYEDWDATVYAKWVQGLTALLKPDDRYPYFMQLPAWNKKNLNTALASWAELKHDAVLYAEQPMAAECGGGGDCEPPPEPYVLGYVEPNVNYWKQALDVLTLTETLLDKHGLLDATLKAKQASLRELCAFLLATSEKELKGQKLTEQEYRTIEGIGASVDYLTLSIIDVPNWEAVTSADKEIAVVTDVYTNNAGEKQGILHEAVGYGNDLYVLVEIEGYLYITKGATFSYYEFPMPLNQRMTDEAWQEKLKQGNPFKPPVWMNDIIIVPDKKIQPNAQEYLYSSGC